MGRRQTLARAIKLRQQKQRPPAILVLPTWACPNGEPRATWALDRRAPTEAELVAAFLAAGFPEAQAKTAAAKIVGRKPFTPKPGTSRQPAQHEEK